MSRWSSFSYHVIKNANITETKEVRQKQLKKEIILDDKILKTEKILFISLERLIAMLWS